MNIITLTVFLFFFQVAESPTPTPYMSLVPTTTNYWYQNPTVIVAFITPILGLISGIIMFKINKWWDKNKKNEN